MRVLGVGVFMDWLEAERLLNELDVSCAKVVLPVGWRRGGFGVRHSESIRRCF